MTTSLSREIDARPTNRSAQFVSNRTPHAIRSLRMTQETRRFLCKASVIPRRLTKLSHDRMARLTGVRRTSQGKCPDPASSSGWRSVTGKGAAARSTPFELVQQTLHQLLSLHQHVPEIPWPRCGRPRASAGADSRAAGRAVWRCHRRSASAPSSARSGAVSFLARISGDVGVERLSRRAQIPRSTVHRDRRAPGPPT